MAEDLLSLFHYDTVPVHTSSDEAVIIATACDSNYFPLFRCFGESLYQYCNASRQYEVHLLYDKIPGEMLMKVEKQFASYPNIQLSLVDMSDFPELDNMTTERKSTYFRIVLPKLFRNRRKVMYLDTDVIFNGDISYLFDMNISSYHILGLESPYIPLNTIDRPINHKFYQGTLRGYLCDYLDFSESELSQHFCAGFVVLNIENIARDGLDNVMIEQLGGKYALYDMDILNIVFRGRSRVLPLEHYAQSEFASEYSDILSAQAIEAYRHQTRKAPIIHGFKAFTSSLLHDHLFILDYGFFLNIAYKYLDDFTLKSNAFLANLPMVYDTIYSSDVLTDEAREATKQFIESTLKKYRGYDYVLEQISQERRSARKVNQREEKIVSELINIKTELANSKSELENCQVELLKSRSALDAVQNSKLHKLLNMALSFQRYLLRKS